MKKAKIAAMAVIILSGFSVSSYAQATATANSSAIIVTPIAISKTVDMNFGNVAVSASTAGTVVLAPAGHPHRNRRRNASRNIRKCSSRVFQCNRGRCLYLFYYAAIV